MNAVLVRKDASPKEYREAVEKAKKAWSDHGKRPAWGCKWYDVWFDNMEKGVDTGQKPVVVYYPNMVGLGKVSMEDLSNPDVPLWDSDSSNRGLGGSQKVEVATMDCMRQQHGPGSARDYIEMDVTTFMNLSLSVDDRVIGWNEDKGKWMSGVITRKGELEPRNKEDACFRWTVQVHESEECFETSRIRPDKGEMDGLEEKLVQKDFVRSLKKSLPKGQQLISTCPRKEWLQDGAPAMTFDIRSQDVASIQKLCSDVLCGDFEVSFNRAAFQHQTNTAGSPGEKIDYWQLQVNKTEFVKAYKSMLMSSTRLTPHQQDRLSKLDGSQHFHLKAAAGSGKTFVAAHKVVNTLLEKDEGRVLFVAPCKSLCLHFVRWLLAMDTGFGAEERICSRLKLMCEPYKSFMTVSVTDKKQLQLPEEKSSVEAQFILAVVDEAHDIFRSDVDQGLLKETLRRSNQCILLSDLSQSSAWDQNYHDLGHYDEVYLTQNVRSTERVVLGAKPFQLSPEHEQGDVVSIGSNGPPLKTYIFEREETGSPPFQEYCRHIIAALKHVVSSYPGLSFHHNVAIIVPDLDFLNSFQEHLKKALKEEIVQTTLSKRLGLISFEESLSYLVSPDAADEGSIEELILDSIGNAKGLEQLIVIVVGMDAQIKSQGDAHDLATRARLYQSITRAQLTAVVVNELLPDGWLAHLATCKLKEGQFQKQEAHMESDTAVATKLVQEIQARGPEERPAHREDPPLETIATALPNGSEEPAASAPSRSPSKPSAPPTEQKKTVIGMRPSSVWDTSQNSTPSPIYDLKFDPMKPQSAFKMLKSQLRQVPLPATCPCPEDVLVCWYNSADEKLSGGELQRRKRLYLFHRNGAFLRREDFWFFAASEASEDPELAARAVRGATRYIFEGRYAVAPAERRVTVTWDRRAFADCTGAAAAPREVRFGPWGAFGRGDGFVYDLEELSERSKRPGVKPLAWPDHQLSEETLKDLEEQRKKDGSWNPENLWFFTADLGTELRRDAVECRSVVECRGVNVSNPNEGCLKMPEVTVAVRSASSGRRCLSLSGDGANAKCSEFDFQAMHLQLLIGEVARDESIEDGAGHVCDVLHRVGQPVVLDFEAFGQAMKEIRAAGAAGRSESSLNCLAQAEELRKCFEDFDPEKKGFLPRSTIAKIMSIDSLALWSLCTGVDA
ncbi:Uncharacterized protein SCF082_LOCUS16621 [Durusdinium trenchii]|uniref:EF-hand domain-containing protein n=1 Tax=Durusdinium trenchii TaxID=1381693 RepID=A0ABP0KEE4_9DINO